jgi:hypothetical protein
MRRSDHDTYDERKPMPTLIHVENTTSADVIALMSHWRYFKYRLETTITLLKKYRNARKNGKIEDELSYQESYDLVLYLEDILDSGSRLERKVFPEDYTRKKPQNSTSKSSSVPMDETLSETSII